MTLSGVKPRITVLGTGYLGATHAICMAVLVHEVLGIDTTSRRSPHSGRTGAVLLARTTRNAAQGPGLRLRFGTDIAEAAVFGGVHLVCVGTRQAEDSPAADLTYVHQAVTDLSWHLHRR